MKKKEFSCEDVFDVFDEYYAFNLNQEDFSLKYKEDLDRILCILLFNQKVGVWGEDFCNNIFDILELESSRCIIPMLHNILQIANVDLTFLQLYRCLEYLYMIYRAIYLSAEYGIELQRILQLLDNEKLRYPEGLSIREIIDKYCDKGLIQKYYTYMVKNLKYEEGKEENQKEKVAEYIYTTRCKIAHFKYGQEAIEDRESLLESVIILAEVVKGIFAKLDSQIVQINEKLNIWNEIMKIKSDGNKDKVL